MLVAFGHNTQDLKLLFASVRANADSLHAMIRYMRQAVSKITAFWFEQLFALYYDKLALVCDTLSSNISIDEEHIRTSQGVCLIINV